ncbi:MAG: hypothetical protein WBH04_15785 [Albidovulum sp.]
MALSVIFMEWYDRGTSEGLKFDVEVALLLAEACLNDAVGDMARASALLNLGNVQVALFAFDRNPTLPVDAEASYRKSMKLNRKRDTWIWGMAHIGLSNAIMSLALSSGNLQRLQEAIAAAQVASDVFDRADTPAEWGVAQNGLGSSLQNWGERIGGPPILEDAIQAYEKALTVILPANSARLWVSLQNGLGNSNKILGEWNFESGQFAIGMTYLRNAAQAFSAALSVIVPEKEPVLWATCKGNYGNVLSRIGLHSKSSADCDAAIDSYQAALDIWMKLGIGPQILSTQENIAATLIERNFFEPRTENLERAEAILRELTDGAQADHTSLDWAKLQVNWASLKLAYFDQTKKHGHLDEASKHAYVARKIFLNSGADQNRRRIDRLLSTIARRRR